MTLLSKVSVLLRSLRQTPLEPDSPIYRSDPRYGLNSKSFFQRSTLPSTVFRFRRRSSLPLKSWLLTRKFYLARMEVEQ